MALVSVRGTSFDDLFSYSYPYSYGYPYGGGNLVAYSAYSGYGSPAATALARAPPKTLNPFKSQLPFYGGQIGAPNEVRPSLRPPNDRLDRLTRLAVEKLDLGSQALRGLADEADRLKLTLRDSDSGGEPDLREQLRLANMEIHRLRTQLLTGVGKEEEQAPAPQGFYADEAQYHQHAAAGEEYPRGEDHQQEYEQYHAEQLAYGAYPGEHEQPQDEEVHQIQDHEGRARYIETFQ